MLLDRPQNFSKQLNQAIKVLDEKYPDKIEKSKPLIYKLSEEVLTKEFFREKHVKIEKQNVIEFLSMYNRGFDIFTIIFYFFPNIVVNVKGEFLKSILKNIGIESKEQIFIDIAQYIYNRASRGTDIISFVEAGFKQLIAGEFAIEQGEENLTTPSKNTHTEEKKAKSNWYKKAL